MAVRDLSQVWRLCAASIILACAALPAMAATAATESPPAEAAQQPRKSVLGAPFSLTDHTGRQVTDETFRGKYMLIYFGYTFCPDVCPTDLAVMASALDLLGPLADDIQPLFVTLDPKRDTVAQLADYVGLFHPRLIGLTGDEKEIARLADSYRVQFSIRGYVDSKDYVVAHTARIFLMGPDGRYLLWFPHADDPAKVAQAIRKTIERSAGQHSNKQP